LTAYTDRTLLYYVQASAPNILIITLEAKLFSCI
jgi:hypothetical protein